MEANRARIYVGEAIGTAFDWYARTWQVVLPPALIVYGLLFAGGVLLDRWASSDSTDSTVGVVAGLFLLAVGLVSAFVAYTLLQGVYIRAAARAHAEEDMPALGEAMREQTTTLWPLIKASVLAAFGIMLGIICLVVPGIVLTVWWSFVGIAVVLEGRQARPSLARSRALAKGNFWRIFFLIVLVTIIAQIVSGFTRFFLGIFLSSDSDWVGALLDTFASALAAPIMLHAVAAAYFQLMDAQAAGAILPALDDGPRVESGDAVPMHSIKAARSRDGYVVVGRSDTDQCYVIASAELVQCTEDDLLMMAEGLDRQVRGDDSRGRADVAVRYEAVAKDSTLEQYLAGRELVDGLWLDAEIDTPELRERIAQYIGHTAPAPW